MSSFPETIRMGATLTEAAARMRAFDIGFLPVVSGTDVVGVITDRDLIVRGMTEGVKPAHIPVGGIMTTELVCCDEDASLDTVARAMLVQEVRRVLVIGPAGRPVGVVSLADLARAGHEGVAALILGVLSRCIPGLPPELPSRL
jgi:CBS domain-containing protein